MRSEQVSSLEKKVIRDTIRIEKSQQRQQFSCERIALRDLFKGECPGCCYRLGMAKHILTTFRQKNARLRLQRVQILSKAATGLLDIGCGLIQRKRKTIKSLNDVANLMILHFSKQ